MAYSPVIADTNAKLWNLSWLTTPCADIDTPRIQNESGFDGGGNAADTSCFVNPD
jgi:hypothetical protein